ncbi:hypothetical protein TNCV_1955861 [Trichonephila clavipes]|nr:hypothetical protein TNCV_1955861 [Trichonephila clavipes]
MLHHLEDNIQRVIADIWPQMLEKLIENWTSRLDYIRASRGSPMPDIIFKMGKRGGTPETFSPDFTPIVPSRESTPWRKKEKDPSESWKKFPGVMGLGIIKRRHDIKMKRRKNTPSDGATAYQLLPRSINRQVANGVTKNDANLALSSTFHYVSIESPL